jgi:hypothetical protein
VNRLANQAPRVLHMLLKETVCAACLRHAMLTHASCLCCVPTGQEMRVIFISTVLSDPSYLPAPKQSKVHTRVGLALVRSIQLLHQ